jgi:hypothetical protein
MKFASHIVRKGIIAKLKNAITYNSAIVPVYGRVPDNATYPYIKVGDAEMNEDEFNSSSYIQSVSTLIEVVSRFDSDTNGGTQADIITNSLMQLVRTRSANYMNLVSDGFKVYSQTIEYVNRLEEADQDHYYYRNIISLNVRLDQL